LSPRVKAWCAAFRSFREGGIKTAAGPEVAEEEGVESDVDEAPAAGVAVESAPGRDEGKEDEDDEAGAGVSPAAGV